MEETVGKRKTFIQKLTLVLIGIGFAFLLSVGVDRLFGWYLQKINYFTAFTPGLSVSYATTEYASTVNINSQGIRNQEVIMPKPANTYRILAVGDSTTFGWGVDLNQTWEKQLEKQLNISGKNVEIIDAGVPGNNIPADSRVCQDYADRFNIDAVIVGFNGLDDTVQGEAEITPLVFIESFLWPNITNYRYIGRSLESVDARQSQFITTEYWSLKARNYAFNNPDVLKNISLQVKALFLTGKILPAVVSYAHEDPNFFLHILDTNFFQQRKNLLENMFASLKKDCAGNRPLFVLFIPDSSLLSKSNFAYREEEGFIMDQKLNTFDFDTPMKQIAKNVGFYYIPTLPDMRKITCSTCYFHYDGHPTATADAYFAQIAAPQVQSILDRIVK